jgi:hypothetical protein
VCTIFSSYSIGFRTSDLLSRRDEIISDLKELKLRKWLQLVKDRKAWNDLVQMTKINVGLWSQKKKKEKLKIFPLSQ